MNARCGCTAFKECLNKQIQLNAFFSYFSAAISFTFTSSLYFKLNNVQNCMNRQSERFFVVI